MLSGAEKKRGRGRWYLRAVWVDFLLVPVLLVYEGNMYHLICSVSLF